jgi:hypothetical protein
LHTSRGRVLSQLLWPPCGCGREHVPAKHTTPAVQAKSRTLLILPGKWKKKNGWLDRQLVRCPRSGTSSWGVCMPPLNHVPGGRWRICVGVPTRSPAPCTTLCLSCPPFLPARPTGHPRLSSGPPPLLPLPSPVGHPQLASGARRGQYPHPHVPCSLGGVFESPRLLLPVAPPPPGASRRPLACARRARGTGSGHSPPERVSTAGGMSP